MTRKGVWGLQGVRDKYLQSLWVQSKKMWAIGSSAAMGDTQMFGKPTNGDPTSIRKTTPASAAGAKDWDMMSCSNMSNQHGYYREMGTDDWYVMGRQVNGSLGLNSSGSEKEDTPQAFPAGTGKTWATFASSRDVSLGTKTDGTLWAWGKNDDGELGQNDRTFRSSPVQIPGTNWGTTFGSVMSAVYPAKQVGAIKQDGTMWTWGNGGALLGLNDNNDRSSPTQVGNPGETAWSRWHTGMGGAIKSDGTCWVWGNGWMGALGLNQGNGNGGNPGGDYSSPKQIPGTTWKHVSMGEVNRFAVKTDGSLWVWGWNNYGNLGLNTRGVNAPYWGTQYSGSRSSPTQLMADQSWSQVDVTSSGAIAINTDGELWGWGVNNGYYAGGTLGLGTSPSADNINMSSPVQLSTTKFGTSDGEHMCGWYCWGMIQPAIPAALE